MKITADLPALADAAAWVAQAISRKAPAPILAGMKLTASDAELTLQASDYDTSHTATIPVDVEEPGVRLLHGPLLRDYLNALRGDTVTIDSPDDAADARIEAGRSTFQAVRLAADEYPTLADMPPIVGKVAADELARLIRHVKHNVDDAAPISNVRGLRLEADDTGLTAVGLQMAGASIATTPWSGGELACQVPVRALEAAVKGLRGEIHVGHDDGIIGLGNDTRTVTLRTLTGEFAKWRVILRDESPITVTVDRAEMLEAIKRVSLVSPDAPLLLTPSLVGIDLAATDGSRGGGISESLAADIDGDLPDLIKFNGQMLSAFLAATDAERVTFGIVTAGKAITITPDDALSQHLVMPRRVA